MSEETIKVGADQETICCEGGEDSLGHPAVYYSFNETKKVVCNYCGKTFIKEEN